MKKQITISEIANELKLSKTAISFVLNGKGREMGISEQTQKKILQHLEHINYIPNVSARGLRTGKTKTIAMMVEDISDPFFSSIARVVEEIAYTKGYKILFSSTENDSQRARDLIQVFRRRQVDGYIIAPPPCIEPEISELLDDGLAVVLFDRTLPTLKVDNVLVDNFQSSYNGIKHLINNGYENIAMISLISEQIQMVERHRGYQTVMDEVNKQYIIKSVVYHDAVADNISILQNFFIENSHIDAVFFTTNYLAESGLEAIRNLNLRIPDDLGVIVFDDDKLFRLFTPSITAIAQPISEISTQAVKLILMSLTNKGFKTTAQNVLLKTALQIRESSQPRKNTHE
ncbi:transcriptional regulator, LacI family [Mucilaginibacter gossypiicola]|uniref:Transcriptional regulator, LacI family n=1 Tax=Mucilaginibacter gossypiicola TaxID=551995 RepID=A0A1H8LQ01_9SPHI|nr:substrate-binding domain-containing protein [Mucilaginibacter gossypiicola]SEO07164.1 transcriptional regulator, LacI family [Mucilaginibacter gossypiicola]